MIISQPIFRFVGVVFDGDHDFEGPRDPKAHLDTVNRNLLDHLGRPFNALKQSGSKWSAPPRPSVLTAVSSFLNPSSLGTNPSSTQHQQETSHVAMSMTTPYSPSLTTGWRTQETVEIVIGFWLRNRVVYGCRSGPIIVKMWPKPKRRDRDERQLLVLCLSLFGHGGTPGRRRSIPLPNRARTLRLLRGRVIWLGQLEVKPL